MNRFSPKVVEKLKYYVYLYIDPRNEQVFYIGKGKANRAFSHLGELRDCDKVRRITELKKLNLEPRIEILKYGLTEKEALLVEATAIDLLDISNLTNAARGHGTRYGARASVQEIVDRLDSRPAKITDPVLLVNISRAFHYGMSPIELYDATRSAWVLGAKKDEVKYVFGVYQGIVREVYEVTYWLPGGSSMRYDDYHGNKAKSHRWEFVGILAPEEIRRKYLNRSVEEYFKRGSQNPVKYVNC
ncbi:hypothetical protein NG895_05305 [Aeoliella sp. ICT_H6.2]|uniref:GIY-YIG domain-containing protein n=1 Tax=Aeoliella straminimaris TaxID=2954799 RepID=A0A9X2JFH3_9BACT|nr:hypothetical protein [Aeoliella straminimaris]MCO6043317.1 hypothetical protein [Aeoliella straminimaris]